MKRVQLHKGRDISIQRQHPWIFSRAVKITEPIEEGERVIVRDHRGIDRCQAHYHDASIMLRVLTEDIEIDIQAYWDDTIGRAIHLRDSLGFPNESTDAYRLINGEGDHASGLIIDVYGNTAVIQCHTYGMHRELDQIVSSLKRYGEGVISYIYTKPVRSLKEKYENVRAGYLGKEGPEVVQFKEHGIRYESNLELAQKTGFFIDQRDNRQLIGSLSEGKSVMNNYCYTGGFSLCALEGGATKVSSIDISAKAIEQLEALLDLNKFNDDRHESIVADVKKYLATDDTQMYDIVITDPPAFAKSQKKRHSAVQAYKRMNAMAMKHVKPGGMLFAFSCSQVVGRQLFYDTLVAAAMESGRSVQVIYQLDQGPDHTINIFHTEGHYLKGLGMIIS